MSCKTAFLTGERLYLRPLVSEDASGAYPGWLNDAEVCRFNGHGRWPYSTENAISYIQSAGESRSALVLAMILHEEDLHIGNISLQAINLIDRSAEFAVLLGERAAWGKGYAKEAGYLLCRHGFEELNLHRIHCGTSKENIAMQRLAAYLGMELEGCRRQAAFKHGVYHDILVYGVLRDEFFLKFPVA